MASESNPMQTLRRQLDTMRRRNIASADRIRAAMIVAMIDGADKYEIETMARAVGLHLDDAEPDSTV